MSRPSRLVFEQTQQAEGFSRRTIDRARSKLKCEGIPPSKLRERLDGACRQVRQLRQPNGDRAAGGRFSTESGTDFSEPERT
jgi:hypothetical protein